MCGHVESEHADMVAALDGAHAAMADFVRSPDEGTRTGALTAVKIAAQVTTTHLDHEEEELEPIMTGFYDTPEWAAVEKQLRKAPVRESGDFMLWINDGATPTVKASIDAHVPRPLQFVFGRLFGHRYRSQVAPVWQ